MATKDMTAGMRRPGLLQYAMCYAIWFLLCISTFWSLLVIRDDIRVLSSLLGLHPFTAGAIDRVAIIVMAILALIIVILIEHHLRTGLEKRKFWPRAIRMSLVLAVLLGAAYAAQSLMFRLFA